MAVGCMANRQIAQALHCSHTTVAHHIARLGRHCLLFHSLQLAHLPQLREIAIDGFETFEWSQYFPFNHEVAVDVETSFFLYHVDSPLRRKGRMTTFQRTRRAELEARLGRPHPSTVVEGVTELLQVITMGSNPITIRSDDHKAYPRAIARIARSIKHKTVSSRERRDSRNPLFEINALDLLVRHCTAAHKRETIAFVKRRQASAEKLSILQVWRNNIKRRREKGSKVTAAMFMGLTSRPLTVGDVLARRLFYDKVPMGHRWKRYYRRLVSTPVLGLNRRHELTYAF
jgi:hypothetical protein